MVRDAGGIPVLNEAAIIPFKARAWLDLTKQRAETGQPDEKNIKKHRNDVARLVQLLDAEASYPLSDTVRANMLAFVEAIPSEADYNPKSFHVNMTKEVVAERLCAAYRL